MNRKRLIVWVLVIACAAGVFFGGRAFLRWRARNRAATAFARLSRCLIGSEPSRDPPARRLRLIELGILERKLSKAPAAEDADWPARCDAYAHELDRAIPDASYGKTGDDDAQRIMGAIGEVRRKIREGQLPGQDFDSELAEMWVASRIAGTVGDVSGVPLAPSPAKLVGLGVIPPLADEGIVDEFEPLAGRSLRFRLYNHPPVIEIVGSSDEAKTLLHARRHSVHANVASFTRALVSVDDDAKPLLGVDDFTQGGVYSVATGERLVDTTAPGQHGAWGKANGFVASVEGTEHDATGKVVYAKVFTLVRHLPNGTITRTPLERPKAATTDDTIGMIVAPGWLLWAEKEKGASERTLYAREILEGEAAVGPIVEIGKVPAGTFVRHRSRFCRTEEALFVELDDDVGDTPVLASVASGKWHVTRAIGGLGSLSCTGSRAFYTGLATAAGTDKYQPGPVEVRQVACTLDACEPAKIAPLPFELSAADLREKFAVTTLGDVVAFLALQDDALTMRLAPIGELSKASVRILDDRDYRKGGTMLHGIYLRARGRFAVLFANTMRGGIALRLDTTGKLEPVVLDPE
jgi:hypothetical protein